MDIRDLVKNPDRYIGREVHYIGEIFSIQEDSSGTTMQAWIDVPGGELDRENMMIFWPGSSEGIFKKTRVEFWGQCLGAMTGQNAFGATIRVPAAKAKYLTKG